MTTIKKVIIQLTVLVEADEADTVAAASLETIVYEITEGQWIGAYEHIRTEDIQSENVAAELVAIGNDGTYFNREDI